MDAADRDFDSACGETETIYANGSDFLAAMDEAIARNEKSK